VFASIAIGPLDTAIIVAYMLGVVSLGLWIGRGHAGSLDDYLLGGHELPWWALLGSIVATETSTATFLSIPGIAYAADGDLRFLQLALGYIIGRGIVVFVLLPLYFRGELYSAYEMLEKRFGGPTKQLAALLFLFGRNLGDGLRLFLTAIVLDTVTGFSLPVCVVLVGLATIVYTVFGGMRSIVWNDCIQFVLYMAGGVVMAVLIVKLLPGGWQLFAAFAGEHDKLRVFDFRFDVSEPYVFCTALIGGIFLTMGTHGTDQMMVQRYLCARNQGDAGRALFYSGIVVFFQFALFLLIGVGLACFFSIVKPSTPIERGDQAVGVFLVDRMPAGLLGLLLAAVFAAAMSTLSSSLNSSAASALNDLYLPFAKEKPEGPQLVRLSRRLTIVFGVIQIGVGIGAGYLSRNVVSEALAIAGFVVGILLGVFLLGLWVPRANARAATLAMTCGLAATAAAKFGPPLVRLWSPKFSESIAWPWLPVVGSLTTLTTGWLLTHLHASLRYTDGEMS
jgi:SSS family transporter